MKHEPVFVVGAAITAKEIQAAKEAIHESSALSDFNKLVEKDRGIVITQEAKQLTKLLELMPHPEEIKSGQERRRERRKQERKNSKK